MSGELFGCLIWRPAPQAWNNTEDSPTTENDSAQNITRVQAEKPCHLTGATKVLKLPG